MLTSSCVRKKNPGESDFLVAEKHAGDIKSYISTAKTGGGGMGFYYKYL